MIPHQLFTTFLSITVSTKINVPLSSDQESPNVQQYDPPKAYKLPQADCVKPASDVQYDIQSGQQQPLSGGPEIDAVNSYSTYTRARIWNEKTVVDHVRFTTLEGKSEIYSLENAFPNIPLYQHTARAWGPTPRGDNITVRFDREASLRKIVMAYVEDDVSQEGFVTMYSWLNNKLFLQQTLFLKKDWTEFQTPRALDRFDLVFRATRANTQAGIGLLTWLEWDVTGANPPQQKE